jgi:integrase
LSRGLGYRLVGVRRLTEGRASKTGACQAVGVPEYTGQGLRRLAVDALYDAAHESKVDVGTVAAIMGHSPATALRHYRTPSRKAKRAAVLAAGLGTVPDRGEATASS